MSITPVIRPDLAQVAEWIAPHSRVLDLGCGDGTLLAYLRDTKGVSGYGVEIDDAALVACMGRGVNVIQADLESGLSLFDTGSFDYVILSQTLQAVRHTEAILQEMLRVAREGIVSFPNFGYIGNRLQLLMGRMPMTDDLPYQWYNTPNIHLCTIRDFRSLCDRLGLRILEQAVHHQGDRVTVLPNLLGSIALFRFHHGGAER